MENGRIVVNPDTNVSDAGCYGTMEPNTMGSEINQEGMEMIPKNKATTDEINYLPTDEAVKLPVTDTPSGVLDPNKKRKRSQSRYDKTWNAAWYEFCENTSVHGLRQIAEIQPYVIRRLVWLILVLTGLALFLYQMISGIMYYYEYPVTVNVKINYNETIRFPALTICNQNAFRKTVAAEKGWYFLLSDMFSGGELKEVDLARYNATDVELYDIYNTAGHDKEDLIVKCQWDAHPCSTDDFSTTMTDYGKCYTFNGNVSKQKQAWRTGAEGGLQILVNIEQYEYMPGPNQGAGLRVHLHSQHEAPLVRDFGIAMPPGSNSLLGTRILVVHNLPHPHGKCDSTQLKYYNHYSKKNCLENCKQKWLEERCGCKHINMVDNMYSKTYCNLTKYQECGIDTLHIFHDMHTYCACPIPCEMESLELFNSIGDISGFDALNLLNSPLTAAIHHKFVKSKEVSQRVNQRIVKRDLEMVNVLQNSVNDLESAVQLITRSLETLQTKINKNFSTLEQRITFHKRKGLEKVLYIMEHDFVRGWEIIEERTLPYLTFGFFELRGSFRRAIEGMQEAMNDTEQEQTLALSRWYYVEDTFEERLAIVQRVFDNVTEVHESYKNGDPLLTFKSSLGRRYDMSWITVELLQAVVDNGSHNQDEIYDSFYHSLGRLNASIHSYLEMGRNFVETYSINNRQWTSTDKHFRSACTSYNYNIFLYKERIVDGPVIVINDKIREFDLLNRSLYSAKDSLYLTVTLLLDSIAHVQNTSWASVNKSIGFAHQYLDDQGTNKTVLAEQFTSNGMMQTLKDMELFFSGLRSGGRSVEEKVQTLEIAIEHIWTNMLNEYTTAKFYAMVYDDFTNSATDPDFYLPYLANLLGENTRKLAKNTREEMEYRLNADFHTMNLTGKLDEVSTGFDHLQNSTNIARLIGIRDESFISNVHILVKSLAAFTRETQIDESFYQKNFIQLDVFMQELSYEEIIQQPGYDMMKLLGDIGGSVGLFLGASALTIAEVLDVLLQQMVRAAMMT